ncbi:MAG: hypothetical protein RLZZ15_3840 [Verrucomicrobiota bacterium]|jgi:hypothetical protein
MDSLVQLTWCAKLLAVGLLVQTAELLWRWRDLRPGGLLHWGTWDLLHAAPIARRARGLMRFRVTLLALLARAALALAVLALPFDHSAMPWLLGGLLVAQVHYHTRFAMLPGSCDHMFLHGLFSLGAGATVVADPRVRTAALVYFAAMLALAYTSVALGKLRVRGWRDGRYLVDAFRGSEFHFRPIADFLAPRPALARLAAWATMLLHLALGLAALCPPPLLPWLLAGGVAFHLGVAALMGLNGFLWAFCAGYPAVLYVNALLH